MAQSDGGFGAASYSPELSPVERLFEELRAGLSNRIFENVGEIM